MARSLDGIDNQRNYHRILTEGICGECGEFTNTHDIHTGRCNDCSKQLRKERT